MKRITDPQFQGLFRVSGGDRSSWLQLTVVKEEILGRSLVARKRALFFYTTMGLAPKRSHLAVESVIPCAILKAFSGDVVFDILCEAWISAGFLAASIAAALKRLLSTSFVSHLAPAIPTRIANNFCRVPPNNLGIVTNIFFVIIVLCKPRALL
ncbi:hypothetical protein QUA70_20230 [Microcoleus sp. LAD1_D5]|uniref:hypothetical protein n=1 Tax=unclassified Microcoleus TaxID=2642155 RepID=UPI002FD1AEDD